MISNNICKIAEFKDAVYYEAICDCMADSHNQTLIVEVDEETKGINLQIYSKVITQQFTSWDSQYEYREALSKGDYFKIAYYKAKLIAEHIIARAKFTYDIWVKGYVQVENQFIFRNEHAINDYVDAITSAKIKIKENKNAGPAPEGN